MSALKMLQRGGAQDPLYVDDVFEVRLRTGTGTSATVTNNIDLSTNGGLVWTKARSAATGHRFTDTLRGATKSLDSSSTAAEATEAQGITSFSTTGYVVGTDTDYNNSTGPVTYADFVFRKAPKFFDVVTFTTDANSAATFNHNLGASPGMIVIKRTDGTANWSVYHRSTTNPNNYYLKLNDTTAETNHLSQWITVTSSSITISSGSQLSFSAAHVAYLFAHDTATDGIIQCGSFTTDGSGNATVNLGWEPQFLIYKASSTTSNWRMVDSMRGFTAPNSTADNKSPWIYANSNGAEVATSGSTQANATGFSVVGLGVSETHSYLAIRRPNKPPTSGTQVYNAIASTPSSGSAFTVGFPHDLAIFGQRSGADSGNWTFEDRLRGFASSSTASVLQLRSSSTGAEITTASASTAYYSPNNTGATYGPYYSGVSSVFNFFRRAPGVFDVVCYTGTGSATTVAHNLGVVPELMIVKCRTNGAGATNWPVFHSSISPSESLWLQSSNAKNSLNYWNSSAPTASVFSVGGGSEVGRLNDIYVAYLFATKAGISKVGSYTGNGSNQTINCGFSAGARFVLIKRTDSTGDWYVWDSARGIVAGNDPHLSLNTTAAEVTTDDSIDPDNSGFIVNQLAATNINVNAATYIFLAFA